MALDILRKGDNFQWYVITFLVLVVYVYMNEISRKNWKGIAAGLALYAVHWFHDILRSDGTPYNTDEKALIQEITRGDMA
jgi:hypothetical protein